MSCVFEGNGRTRPREIRTLHMGRMSSVRVETADKRDEHGLQERQQILSIKNRMLAKMGHPEYTREGRGMLRVEFLDYSKAAIILFDSPTDVQGVIQCEVCLTTKFIVKANIDAISDEIEHFIKTHNCQPLADIMPLVNKLRFDGAIVDIKCN